MLLRKTQRASNARTSKSVAVTVAVALAGACNGSGSALTLPGDDGGVTASSRGGGGTADASRDGRTDASSHAPDSGPPLEASAASADAPADVDNGAPSTVYPASHPPLPQLTNLAGGPILASPKVYLVVYPGYPYVGDLQTYAMNMTQASYWGEVTSEYGVGALSYGGTITLAGQTAPAMISSTTIEAWVASELASGAFGTPDPEGIYTILYPQSTLVTQPNPVLPSLAPVQSCVAFGGYHDNTTVALTDGGTPTNFAYAVIPTCSTAVDDLTAVISHEWVEASTDPFLTSTGAFTLTGGPDSAFFTVDAAHAIWALLDGGEAGDLCEPEGQSAYVTPADVGYTVQRTWSNKLALGSHDPCTPSLPSTPYFNSSPVLPENVSVTSALIGGTIMSQGVTIPAATSKTIEVDLFSDSATSGPWTVTAADALYQYYGSYGVPNTLAFQWDRTSGVNGDKLHLTITVTNESPIYGVHAFVITSTLGGRQTVWPGLIVE